jgi:cysteine synthase A
LRVAENLTQLIGNTPLVKLNSFSNSDNNSTVIGKCEFMNPMSSVKDRVGMNIIQKALQRGDIDQNTTLIEATSGNTGIGLSAVASSLGLKMVIVMPDSMSIERRSLMSAFGSELVLTPAKEGMRRAIAEAEKLADQIENSYLTKQFQNGDNPDIHSRTTADEIWRDSDGKVDIFVAGVGTGGTLSGVGRELKRRNPDIKVIAVEPKESAVISGDSPSPHKIQGIGAGFIPENLDLDVIDEVIKVPSEDACDGSRQLARKDGLLVGVSSGANAIASQIVANKEENRGKIVVTMLNDTGERYLSTELFRS